MKKMIALILAAVMMLACLPAVAEESAPAATTVNISIAVEKEELKSEQRGGLGNVRVR